MKKIGLVLSGGGSKGAYQVGVIKALKKLHIKYQIVTGTSVGALNALLVTQKEIKKLTKLWNNMSFDIISDKTFPDKYDTIPELTEVYKNYLEVITKEGGLNVQNLEKTCQKAYKPNKFYYSDIDFGIVVFNLSKQKPEFKIKKDLKRNEVVDYIMASSCCYPAFQPKIINGDKYIDGGYYDNYPLNLAVSLGAEEIIGVDLNTVGLIKPIKDKSIKVITISPRNKMSPFLIFDKEISKRILKFGYNDTMKTFKKLDGITFTYKKGNLIKNYEKNIKLMEDKLTEILSNKKEGFIEKIASNLIIKNFHTKKVKPKEFNQIVEYLGKTLNLKEETIYNIKTYNKIIINKINKTKKIDPKKIIANPKESNIKQNIIKYFYDEIKDNHIDSTTTKLIILFPKDFLSALYLSIVVL